MTQHFQFAVLKDRLSIAHLSVETLFTKGLRRDGRHIVQSRGRCLVALDKNGDIISRSWGHGKIPLPETKRGLVSLVTEAASLGASEVVIECGYNARTRVSDKGYDDLYHFVNGYTVPLWNKRTGFLSSFDHRIWQPNIRT